MAPHGAIVTSAPQHRLRIGTRRNPRPRQRIDANLHQRQQGPTARPVQSRDEAYALALRKLVQAHVRSRQTTRVCDALAAVGCWASFRHNRRAFPRVEREVLRLRLSRASAKQLQTGEKTR